MKLLLLSVVVMLAVCSYAGEQASSTPAKRASVKKAPAKEAEVKAPVRQVVITGTHIPITLDRNGRPVDCTLKVIVVSDRAIQTYGFGSVTRTLGYLPFASGR